MLSASKSDNRDADGVRLATMHRVKGLEFDAVFLLESRGLRVRIEGVGRVVSQSLPPHSKYKKGQTIHIKLRR